MKCLQMIFIGKSTTPTKNSQRAFSRRKKPESPDVDPHSACFTVYANHIKSPENRIIEYD